MSRVCPNISVYPESAAPMRGFNRVALLGAHGLAPVATAYRPSRAGPIQSLPLRALVPEVYPSVEGNPAATGSAIRTRRPQLETEVPPPMFQRSHALPEADSGTESSRRAPPVALVLLVA